MPRAATRLDPPQRRLLTIPQAAAYLGRTVWGVRELIWKGKIPAVKIDRRVQVDVRDLDALIERSKSEASA